MSSWKTTLTGFLSAAASFVLFADLEHMIVFPAWVRALAMFVSVGGTATLGVVAKDFNISGKK